MVDSHHTHTQKAADTKLESSIDLYIPQIKGWKNCQCEVAQYRDNSLSISFHRSCGNIILTSIKKRDGFLNCSCPAGARHSVRPNLLRRAAACQIENCEGYVDYRHNAHYRVDCSWKPLLLSRET